MKDMPAAILDQRALEQLRKGGFGRFASLAETLASEAAFICGRVLVTERRSLPNPLTAYSIQWTEKYVSALGPTETRSRSIHKTLEAAITHLKEAFENRECPSPERDFFPDKGWDQPITICVVEITNDGVLAKALAMRETVSDSDYFVHDAAGRRLYSFEEENERYRDFLNDIRRLKPTNGRIEVDIQSGLAHSVKRRFGRDFRKICTFP